MATYGELYGLFNDPALKEKVAVACVVAGDTIRTEDAGTANHANRVKWAKYAFASPVDAATDMLKALLAANKDLTLAQISAATDAAIQSAVNNAVNIFADGS